MMIFRNKLFNFVTITSMVLCVSSFDKCVNYGETCNPNHGVTCCDDNLTCKQTSSSNSLVCIKEAKFLEACNTDADCETIQFAVCSSNKKCTCKDDFTKFDETTCIAKLGKICNTDSECPIESSICKQNKCRCKLGYLNVADKQCVLIESVSRSCYNHDPNCRLFTTASSLENGQYVCTEYRVKINSTSCTASSGDFCSKRSPCVSKYYVCINNKCQCKFKYVSHSSIDCPSPHIAMPCEYDSYCRKFIKHSVCRKNVCICDDHHLEVNNIICLSKLDVFCRNDEKCVVENSDCIDNRCQCILHYVKRGFRCVRMDHIKNCESCEDCNEKNSNTLFIGSRFCRTDRDCSDLRNSRCSLNNICVCKENHFAFNNQTCYPILNGFCSYDKECEKNFHCVDYKCQCKPFFSSVSVHECKETDLLYSCDDNSECSDSWHAKCSKNKKCVCNISNIAVSKTTCLPILDGYCWRDDQCMAGNSICDDFRCKCRPNFIAIADNLCALRN